MPFSGGKKMVRIFFALFLIPWLGFSINCKQFLRTLDPEIVEELEETFRHLIVSTEIGYVIYGNKPVCMLGIDPIPIPNFPCANSKVSIYLQRLCELLRELNYQTKGNFLIRQGGEISANSQEVLFINRNNFLKTVRENLALFQYILGPEVTPEKLLDKILDPKETLFSVLDMNFALVGILLGYGTQNSLFYYRANLLNPNASQYESDPLRNRSILPPSFGHRSSQDELVHLQNIIHHSRDVDPGCYPPPVVFGYIDHKESTKILADFCHNRKKIRKVLQNPLLPQLLPLFFNEFPSVVNDRNKLRIIEPNYLKVLSRQFANVCSHNPTYCDEIWKEAFFEGLKSKSSELLQQVDSMNLNVDLYHARIAYERCIDLKTVDTIFKKLAQRTDLTCVSPGKNYYRILEPGQTPLPDTDSLKVSFSYRLKDFHGTMISGQYEDAVLSEFLTEIASVLKQMKINEVREIWIHPECMSKNSGNNSDLGWQGQVELLAASPCDAVIKNESNLSAEVSLNEEELRNRYIELKKRAAYNYGAEVRRALRFIVDLDQAVLAFREQKDSSELSEEEQDVLFRAHLAFFSKQRKEESQVALQMFQTLNLQCISKNRLYLDLQKKGKGPKIGKNDVVEVEQIISNHLGDILSKKKITYNLQTTIQGFQAGLVGQSVGSKLKLYIHPDWGYKSFSSILGDTFLIAEMEILSIKN